MPAAATTVTPVDLLQVSGAVVELVSVRPSSTMVTPVVPFFTLMDPSAQLPETTYVPASLMVSAVPLTL